MAPAKKTGKTGSKRPSPKRKSPVRIVVRKEGALSKYGYDSKDSAEARHRALRKAVRGSSPVEVVRRLNAVAVLNKNRKPRLAAKFRADMHWVQKNLYPVGKRASPKRKSPKKPAAKRASPKRASPKRASPKRVKSSGRRVTGVTQSLLRAGWRETDSATSRRAVLKKLAKSRGLNFAYNQINNTAKVSNDPVVRKVARADEGWVFKNASKLERSPKRASPKRKSPKMVTVRKAYTRADGRRVKSVRVPANSERGRKVLAARRR